jgi:glycosyltransferase involved in cell wall biosynthesis
MERFFSFIVPVYNRPGELAELLESMTLQNYANFEIVIVEDGSDSDLRSEKLAAKYSDRLEIEYLDLLRSGPSLARNVGTRAARGDWFLYVDSDCILPQDYLKNVNSFLENHQVDFFGGPDRASSDFNLQQKAISYAMTSFLTTGGIRGGKKKIDKFYPRSFNLGISRQAFYQVGGYPETRMHPGEDMVLSIELFRHGFKSGFVQDAFVYHKRRTALAKFFRQVFGFGKTRLIISKVYPETFKIFYLAPAAFLLGSVFLVALTLIAGLWALLPLLVWSGLVLIDATVQNKSLVTGLISVIASFMQLYGYGYGFLSAAWTVIFLRKDKYGVLTKGFYPVRQLKN